MATIEEVVKYLYDNISGADVLMLCASYIMEETEMHPIPITEDMFFKHFYILGTKYKNGELKQEKRGRKVGSRVVGGKVILPDC